VFNKIENITVCIVNAEFYFIELKNVWITGSYQDVDLEGPDPDLVMASRYDNTLLEKSAM